MISLRRRNSCLARLSAVRDRPRPGMPELWGAWIRSSAALWSEVMNRAQPGPGEAGTGGTGAEQRVLSHVHALFQQRVDGDDALLKLAGLRFAQMGVAAEVYADPPGHLEYVLQFVPPHVRLPIVHLSRGINVLHGRDRAVVREFADRFAGRVAGLVVHDKREMGAKTDRLLAAMRELNAHLCARPTGPLVFLEYAAGLDRGWFIEVA